MTRTRATQLLVGLLLTGASFVGVLYQVNESMAGDRAADGSVPRLLCPLH